MGGSPSKPLHDAKQPRFPSCCMPVLLHSTPSDPLTQSCQHCNILWMAAAVPGILTPQLPAGTHDSPVSFQQVVDEEAILELCYSLTHSLASLIDGCCVSSRLILENLLKYGWRLNFISYISRSLAGRGNLPLVLAFPALVLLSLLALAAERLGLYCLRAEEQVGERVCVCWQVYA